MTTAAAFYPGVVCTDLLRYIIGEDKCISIQDTSLTLADQLKVLSTMTKGGDRGANSQIYLSLLQGCDDQNAGKFSINMKETELLPTVMDESKTEKQRLVAFLYNNQTLPSNFCTQF